MYIKVCCFPTVMDYRFKSDLFPFLNIFVSLLELYKVYSVVFIELSYLEIYFFLPSCKLLVAKILKLFMNIFSMIDPAQAL